MAMLDYKKAKSDITEIVEIVKTVPEGLQQRCFEMLFELAFAGKAAPKKDEEEPAGVKKKDEEPQNALAAGRKLTPNVRSFCHRQQISDADIGKLFLFDQDPMLAVYKVPTANKAKGQLMKTLMVLLENALVNNTFSASYGEVREASREEGLYDSNFNQNLKNNAELFRGNLKGGATDETTIELSAAGLDKLGEVVKELLQ